MAVIKNFNRIIDVKLTKTKNLTKLGLAGVFGTGQQSFFIRCPRTGRKPEIEISGQILPSDQVSLFDLKIKNLYDTEIVADLSEVQVSAGYEDTLSAVFTGTPVNVYTSSPGPDRETVIQCTTASFGEWNTKIMKLQLLRGWTLKDAVTQINKALGFSEPAINPKLALLTAQVNWDFTGTAKEALHMLTSDFFPVCSAFIMNNRITITDQVGAEFGQRHEVPFLSSAPQFSGSQVTITAPWNPAIKPNDIVRFNSTYYSASTSLLFDKIKSKSEMVVNQVGFEFSTTGSVNRMTLQGILVGGSK